MQDSSNIFYSRRCQMSPERVKSWPMFNPKPRSEMIWTFTSHEFSLHSIPYNNISAWWLSPTPLKNITNRRLGWWHSQCMENKSHVPFQSPPTRYIIIPIINHRLTIDFVKFPVTSCVPNTFQGHRTGGLGHRRHRPQLQPNLGGPRWRHQQFLTYYSYD